MVSGYHHGALHVFKSISNLDNSVESRLSHISATCVLRNAYFRPNGHSLFNDGNSGLRRASTCTLRSLANCDDVCMSTPVRMGDRSRRERTEFHLQSTAQKCMSEDKVRAKRADFVLLPQKPGNVQYFPNFRPHLLSCVSSFLASLVHRSVRTLQQQTPTKYFAAQRNLREWNTTEIQNATTSKLFVRLFLLIFLLLRRLFQLEWRRRLALHHIHRIVAATGKVTSVSMQSTNSLDWEFK